MPVPPLAATLALPLLWLQVLDMVLVFAVMADGSATIAVAVAVQPLTSLTVIV